MSYLRVGTDNSADIDIYYEDHGQGRPVVLIHGYPLNGHSGERQHRVLLEAGYRVITYDRRGFGRSSQATVGYDYDTFAADLAALLEHLELTDAVLVGFSMGSGEVTRYLGAHRSARVAKAALLGVIPPFRLETDDHPEGGDGKVVADIKSAILTDRYTYFEDFLINFYRTDTGLTDFRGDLAKIDLPVLVVHGTRNRILPIEATANRLPALINDLQLVRVDGGPQNIAWTHADQVNHALLTFLGK